MKGKDYQMPIFYLFEQEAKMLGIYMSSFYNFAALAILTLILPQIVGVLGINLGWQYYIIAVVALIFLYFFLRSMGKKSYPNFIYAWLSFTVLQPKRLSSLEFNLNLKSLKEIADDNREPE